MPTRFRLLRGPSTIRLRPPHVFFYFILHHVLCYAYFEYSKTLNSRSFEAYTLRWLFFLIKKNLPYDGIRAPFPTCGRLIIFTLFWDALHSEKGVGKTISRFRSSPVIRCYKVFPTEPFIKRRCVTSLATLGKSRVVILLANFSFSHIYGHQS